MPPKKQAPRNSFYFFMVEFRKKEKFVGNNLALAEAASPSWQRLPPNEKKKYEQMAKEAKASGKAKAEQYTAQNIPVTFVENYHREKAKQLDDMKKRVFDLVDVAMKENSLPDQEFFFIHFNHFCQLLTKEVIPAEVALAKYSLRKGVIEVFHTLINPGPLPLGFAATAKEHSEKMHKLPIPPFAKGESDYSRILESMVEMFDPQQKMPILFTTEHEVEFAQSIIDYFCRECNVPDEFSVTNITDLFFNVRQATSEIARKPQAYPNIYVAAAEFEKEAFDYHEGMACQFHSEGDPSDKFRNCSTTKVIGWCYSFSDSCCKDLGIKLVPGKHLPKSAEIPLIMPPTAPVRAKSEYMGTASSVSTHTLFDDALSEISSYTAPASSVTSYASTPRPGPSQKGSWKAPSRGPPPGFPAATSNTSLNKSDYNSNNPFLPEISRLNESMRSVSNDEFPPLNQTADTRPPGFRNHGYGRGMPFDKNTSRADRR